MTCEHPAYRYEGTGSPWLICIVCGHRQPNVTRPGYAHDGLREIPLSELRLIADPPASRRLARGAGA